MALIRWGHGSELYIYATDCHGEESYVCSDCRLNVANTTLPDKERLKEHILRHKQVGHSIGLVGGHGTYQSYDELLAAVDDDDF